MFTTRSRMLLAACAAMMCGNTSSCDEGDTGSIQVNFKLGNDRSCTEFGVKRVRAVLDHDVDPVYDPDLSKLNPEHDLPDQTVSCEAKEVTLTNVHRGHWRLRLFGTGKDDDTALMDNLQDSNYQIEIIGDKTVLTDRTVMLTAAPAHLAVRWSFGFGTCESAGIGSFAVTVWRNDGSDLLLDDELDCDEVGDAKDGYYRTIPDHKRLLLGGDKGEVSIQPLSPDGDEIGEPISYKYSAPGAGQSIRLSLKCDKDPDTKTGISCWAERATPDDDDDWGDDYDHDKPDASVTPPKHEAGAGDYDDDADKADAGTDYPPKSSSKK